MSKIEYDVISEVSLARLIKEVQKKLDEGWMLYGVLVLSVNNTLLQPMTRRVK